jgi:hypothetical protein
MSQKNLSRWASIAASVAMLATSLFAVAQPAVLNVGFANVSDSPTSTDCGGYCFGSFWGIGDLKATAAGNTYTLQPNFNTYADNPGVAYWRNNGGAGPLGNKIFEGNLYNQSLVDPDTTSVEFNGTIDSFTIDPAYTVEAYIQVIQPTPFIFFTGATATVTATGAFSVSLDPTAFPGETLQLGFRVRGLNANPADEATLGSVVATVVQAQQVIPPPPPGPTPVPALPLWGLLGLVGLIGFLGLRRRA